MEEAAEEADVEGHESEHEFDGMQMPKDLANAEGHHAEEASSETSSDEELEEYEGTDELSDGEEKEAAAPSGSASSAAAPPTLGLGGHEKKYHLSMEWQELKGRGEHLIRLPPINGAGVNRHPAKSFWSSRYPEQGIRTASWGHSGRTPLKCLILCLRRIIKIYLETKPVDADSWRAQLHDLNAIVPAAAEDLD